MPYAFNIESNWILGYHVNGKFEKIPLSEMSKGKIKRMIRCFKGLETQPLKEELRRKRNVSI